MQTSKVYGEKIGNEVSRRGEEAEAKAGKHRAEKRTQKDTDKLCKRARKCRRKGRKHDPESQLGTKGAREMKKKASRGKRWPFKANTKEGAKRDKNRQTRKRPSHLNASISIFRALLLASSAAISLFSIASLSLTFSQQR